MMTTAAISSGIRLNSDSSSSWLQHSFPMVAPLSPPHGGRKLGRGSRTRKKGEEEGDGTIRFLLLLAKAAVGFQLCLKDYSLCLLGQSSVNVLLNFPMATCGQWLPRRRRPLPPPFLFFHDGFSFLLPGTVRLATRQATANQSIRSASRPPTQRQATTNSSG
jgi:hypothetical protein